MDTELIIAFKSGVLFIFIGLLFISGVIAVGTEKIAKAIRDKKEQ